MTRKQIYGLASEKTRDTQINQCEELADLGLSLVETKIVGPIKRWIGGITFEAYQAV